MPVSSGSWISGLSRDQMNSILSFHEIPRWSVCMPKCTKHWLTQCCLLLSGDIFQPSLSLSSILPSWPISCFFKHCSVLSTLLSPGVPLTVRITSQWSFERCMAHSSNINVPWVACWTQFYPYSAWATLSTPMILITAVIPVAPAQDLFPELQSCTSSYLLHERYHLDGPQTS